MGDDWILSLPAGIHLGTTLGQLGVVGWVGKVLTGDFGSTYRLLTSMTYWVLLCILNWAVITDSGISVNNYDVCLSLNMGG